MVTNTAVAGGTIICTERECLPAGQPLKVAAGAEGARIWLKFTPLQHTAVLKIRGLIHADSRDHRSGR